MNKIIAGAVIGCVAFGFGCRYGEGRGAAKAFFMASGKDGGPEAIKHWVRRNIGRPIQGGVVFGWGFNNCLTLITKAVKNYKTEDKEN